jgi:hypothetical protein
MTGYKDSAGSRETVQPIVRAGLRPAVKMRAVFQGLHLLYEARDGLEIRPATDRLFAPLNNPGCAPVAPTLLFEYRRERFEDLGKRGSLMPVEVMSTVLRTL